MSYHDADEICAACGQHRDEHYLCLNDAGVAVAGSYHQDGNGYICSELPVREYEVRFIDGGSGAEALVGFYMGGTFQNLGRRGSQKEAELLADYLYRLSGATVRVREVVNGYVGDEVYGVGTIPAKPLPPALGGVRDEA